MQLVPYLKDAIEHSPSAYVFPGSGGKMRREDSAPQKILRSALVSAGLVERYVHVCRRCKSRGTPQEEEHEDAAQRRCPRQDCRMLLWPRAVPRPMRFHDLRHTTATLLLRAGVDPYRVQRILRHRDVKTTTAIYGHLDAEDLREAINRLPPCPLPPGEAANESPAEALVTRLLPGSRRAKTEGPAPAENPQENRALELERNTGFEPATFALARRR